MQVRWEELFTQLDAELDAQERAELHAEVAERTRREHAEVAFADRLRALPGSEVVLDVAGIGAVPGVVEEAGQGWLLLRAVHATQAIVVASAVLGLRGAPRTAQLRTGGLADRISLGMVLRGLARERREIQLTRTDGSVITGTIDLVGADYVEIAEHPAGEARRAAAVRTVRLVPMGGVSMVRAS